MREEKTLKLYGLNTYSDIFSIPEGTFSTASNIVIDQNNLISPRRGYEILPRDIDGGGLVNTTEGQTLFYYKGRVHLQLSTGKIYYYNDDNDNWVYYGDDNVIVRPTSETRSRFVAANKNIYATSSQGVQKIDALGGVVRDSGAPQALAASKSAETAGSIIGGGYSVAYRIVWGYKDANNNLILGAPSQRLVVTSTESPAHASDFTLTIPVPLSVDENWFYQIYRSPQVIGIPSDELLLAFEGNPTPTEITNRTLDRKDLQPDDLLGLPLYTNETQEGLANSNFEAPQCADMALYQGHVFYANTIRKSEIIITLQGTGDDGLEEGDAIIINGETYTARATNNVASKEFGLVDSGSSPSQDVVDTAKNLIEVINAANTDILAIYWSEVSSESLELPGLIRLIERDFQTAPSFTISATAHDSDDARVAITWSPNLSGSGTTAVPETKPNRVYYSKFQEPEAVPLPNFFDVGPANSNILRILPLRTSLLIFTEDSIYRLTGTTEAAFQTNLLDNTAKLVSVDSLAVLNNTAFGLFDQGVCSVGESVAVLSRPIEGEFLTIRGATGDALNNTAYGISYESDRKYILYTPVTSTDAANGTIGKAYTYNTVTQAWTTWDKRFTHGIVAAKQDKLFMLAENGVRRERKNFDFFDIADEQIDLTPAAVSGTAITTDPVTLDSIQVGDMYVETQVKFSRVLSINVFDSTFTVQDDLGWDLVPAEIRKAIDIDVRWNPLHMDSPAILKQFSECTLITQVALDNLILSFKGISSGSFEDIEFTSISQGLWGLFPWGEVQWGGAPSVLRYRTYIPVQKQRDSAIFVKLTQRAAFNRFEISGLSIMFRPIGPRTRR